MSRLSGEEELLAAPAGFTLPVHGFVHGSGGAAGKALGKVGSLVQQVVAERRAAVGHAKVKDIKEHSGLTENPATSWSFCAKFQQIRAQCELEDVCTSACGTPSVEHHLVS